MTHPHRRALLLCGALLLGGIAASALVAPSAWAAPAAKDAVFDELGLLELLPPTDVIGDGATPADLWLLALDPKGQPVTGWKVKVSATGGTTTDLVEAGGGLYRFTFTPQKADEPETATIWLKGKLASREAFTRSWSFPVAPPRSAAVKVQANPAQMTLGTDKTANVSFTVTGGDPARLTTMKLVSSVAPGTLGPPTLLAPGRYDLLYTAPTVTKPQVALLTTVDAGDAARTYGGVAIPLAAKVDQAVTVAPKTKVLLKVAGRDFGPVDADAKGRAKVPIVVPPGTSTATRVQIAADGTTSEAPLDLQIPETRRIALFPTAAALPADARVQVPVRAMVVAPDGRPDESAPVEFAVTAGTVGAARHEGGGVYVATWTPPFGNAAVKATLTAKLGGASAVQVDTRPVDLVPVRPTSVALAAEPPTLPAAATALAVVAKVAGPDGAALPGRTLAFSANGAKLQGVVDGKDGTYRATFATTGKGPVEVTARAAAASLGNPLARIVVVPARDALPPDGLSSGMLTVATLDEYGYPVPNVDVALRLVSGDGSIPATVRTNAEGVAQVFYTAGRKNGFVRVEATADGHTAGAAMVQVPEGVAIPDLPIGGAKETVGVAADVAAGIAAIRVERGG